MHVLIPAVRWPVLAAVEPLDAFRTGLDMNAGEELRQGRGTLPGPALSSKWSKRESVCVRVCSSFDSFLKLFLDLLTLFLESSFNKSYSNSFDFISSDSYSFDSFLALVLTPLTLLVTILLTLLTFI